VFLQCHQVGTIESLQQEGIQTAITSIITRIQAMVEHRLYAIPIVLQWALLIMRLLQRNGLILHS